MTWSPDARSAGRLPAGRERPGSGVLAITIGYVAVAGSSVVLLAAGPRLLGSGGFSSLALVWTLSTLFGLGLSNPTEQVVTRRLSAGEPGARRPFGWFAVGALLSILAVVLFGGDLPAARSGTGLVAGTVAAIGGWVCATWVRGTLAGHGRLTRYAVVLVVEATARVGLVAVALLVPSWVEAALTAAVGVPLLLAAAMGVLVRGPGRSAAAMPGSDDQPGEHLYFGIVSMAYQACLNGPALVLDWQVGTAVPALVGSFVAVSTVLRAPSLLVGGLSTQALASLSRSWSRGDRKGYSAGTHALARRWATLVIPTTLLVLVLSPWLLPLYYGSEVGVSTTVVVGLAASTILATGAAVGTAPLFAARRGRVAAAAWAAGALVTMGVLLGSSGSPPWLAVGLVAGPLTAVVVVVRGVLITLRAPDTVVAGAADG